MFRCLFRGSSRGTQGQGGTIVIVAKAEKWIFKQDMNQETVFIREAKEATATEL